MTERFLIDRTDDLPLSFNGRLLADETTQFDEPASKKSPVALTSAGNRLRWSELRIYATDSGKWVTELLAVSSVAGETTFRYVDVANQPAEIRTNIDRRIGKRRGTKHSLPDYVLDALDEAAAADPTLAELLVEHI